MAKRGSAALAAARRRADQALRSVADSAPSSRGLLGVAVLAPLVLTLGVGVGGSSIMSAVSPYPVARPGDAPRG